MKKITDERLIFKNLKNIRITYVIQTLGIIAILSYDIFKNGFNQMTKNPLWFVLMITMITSLYLAMSISVDHEAYDKAPKEGLKIFIIV